MARVPKRTDIAHMHWEEGRLSHASGELPYPGGANRASTYTHAESPEPRVTGTLL